METITVRFTSRWPWNPCSPVIARLAGSKQFSHSMSIIDGIAYEASMTHGCRVVPLDVAMQGVAVYQDMFLPVPNIDAAIQFGKAQDGKGYDWAGALGIPFLASEDWADWSKWWCSEFCFMQIVMGGVWLLDPSEQKRVTPNDLHQCNYPKGAVTHTSHSK